MKRLKENIRRAAAAGLAVWLAAPAAAASYSSRPAAPRSLPGGQAPRLRLAAPAPSPQAGMPRVIPLPGLEPSLLSVVPEWKAQAANPAGPDAGAAPAMGAMSEHLAAVEQALGDLDALPRDAGSESSAGAGARLADAVQGSRSVEAAPDAEAVRAALASGDWSALPLRTRVALAARIGRSVQSEVSKVIVGQDELVRAGMIALALSKGLMLEAVPGTGKTEFSKAMAQVVGAKLARIQFTADMQPMDLIGSNVLEDDGTGRKAKRFIAGPLFGGQLVLADEYNRAPPKTKSAMLEALAEKQATVEGETRPLDKQLTVFATMNPIEQEGTFPLGEAELDRFIMKLTLKQPGLAVMNEIVALNRSKESRPALRAVASLEQFEQIRKVAESLPVSPAIVEYSNRIAMGAMPGADAAIPEIAKLVKYGVYTRASIDLLQAATLDAVFKGQDWVGPENVEAVAPAVLRHRMALTYDALEANQTPDTIIKKVIATVKLQHPHLDGRPRR